VTADDLTELSVDAFLDQVADRTPTPGGGGVSALVAAAGCALARMVAAYSGKGDAASPPTQFHNVLLRADQLFRALITRDAAAYAKLRAVAKRGETGGQRDERAEQAALLTAIAAPLEVAAVAGQVLAELDQWKTLSNPRLRSDLCVAAILLDAAGQGARSLVSLNARDLTDEAQKSKILADLTTIIERCRTHGESLQHFANRGI